MIKGVGRWTAQMLLIFNLGRPDALPIEDLGVRRGYLTLHETYRPYRQAVEKALDEENACFWTALATGKDSLS
jgi:DNA-3-methyladenine glycosylase II